MSGNPNRFELWLSTAVDADGAAVPVPPDLTPPLRELVGIYLREVRRMAPLFVGGSALFMFLRLPTGLTWTEVASRFGLVAAVLLALAIAIPLLVIGIAAAFWPLTRKQAGAAMRCAIEARSIDQITVEMRRCEAAMKRAPPTRKWRFARYLEWLEAELERRQQ